MGIYVKQLYYLMERQQINNQIIMTEYTLTWTL